MFIALVSLGWMLLFTTPSAVLLSVCIGMGSCLCPISLLSCGMALHALM